MQPETTAGAFRHAVRVRAVANAVSGRVEEGEATCPCRGRATSASVRPPVQLGLAGRSLPAFVDGAYPAIRPAGIRPGMFAPGAPVPRPSVPVAPRPTSGPIPAPASGGCFALDAVAAPMPASVTAIRSDAPINRFGRTCHVIRRLFQTLGIPDWQIIHFVMPGEMKKSELAETLPDGPSPPDLAKLERHRSRPWPILRHLGGSRPAAIRARP